MERGGGRRGAVLLACGALLAPAACPAVASASASLHWGGGIKAGLPADASNLFVALGQVSCGSGGNCTAVGDYFDGSMHFQGLLLTQSSGSWSHGVAEAQLPANVNADPSAILQSVSCASAGNCTAVGHYADTGGDLQGLLLTQTDESWSNGTVEATPPPGAYSDPAMQPFAVSCPSVGNCSAIGNYYDSAAYTQGLLLSESKGHWAQGKKAQLPGNATTGDPAVDFSSLSCPSAGNCSAVGTYTDSSSRTQALLLKESSGSWSPGREARLPANASSTVGGFANAVSCPSAGNCTAVGGYRDSADQIQGLLLSESSGFWATGVEAPLPANTAVSRLLEIDAVSCASAGNCTAVGFYRDSANAREGLLLTESKGRWSAAEARVPANANATDPNVRLNSVSCISPGNCAAAGRYFDSLGASQGLLLTQWHGSWSRGLEARLPEGAGSDPAAGFNSVSCASTGRCSAVGGYTDGSNESQGLLLSATPLHPSLSASAPTRDVKGKRIAAAEVAAGLSGGSAPIGTISFRVFGPQPTAPRLCLTGGTVIGTARVTGDKAYHPSATFTPHKTGDYWWYARYGGDASDTPAASKCGVGMARTVVRR